MTLNQQKLLGIDYGSKRIGIALTNETGEYALPYSVVQNSKEVVADILKICVKNNVSKIIIGESKDFLQQNNPIMKEINDFAKKLKEKSNIEIIFHPEFMTSAEAERTQPRRLPSESRLKRRETKNKMLDASAATIILQSYIDKHTNMRMSE